MHIFHILVIALIMWMAVIFLFSSQTSDESANISGEIGRKVVSIFVPGFQKWDEDRKEEFVEKINFFVRKTAHFTEYMILGMLWLFCLQSNPRKNTVLKHNICISIFASTCYAISDEFHQLFVVGRAGRWMDVGIDTLGVIVGVGISGISIKLLQKYYFSRRKIVDIRE